MRTGNILQLLLMIHKRSRPNYHFMLSNSGHLTASNRGLSTIMCTVLIAAIESPVDS